MPITPQPPTRLFQNRIDAAALWRAYLQYTQDHNIGFNPMWEYFGTSEMQRLWYQFEYFHARFLKKAGLEIGSKATQVALSTGLAAAISVPTGPAGMAATATTAAVVGTTAHAMMSGVKSAVYKGHRQWNLSRGRAISEQDKLNPVLDDGFVGRILYAYYYWPGYEIWRIAHGELQRRIKEKLYFKPPKSGERINRNAFSYECMLLDNNLEQQKKFGIIWDTTKFWPMLDYLFFNQSFYTKFQDFKAITASGMPVMGNPEFYKEFILATRFYFLSRDFYVDQFFNQILPKYEIILGRYKGVLAGTNILNDFFRVLHQKIDQRSAVAGPRVSDIGFAIDQRKKINLTHTVSLDIIKGCQPLFSHLSIELQVLFQQFMRSLFLEAVYKTPSSSGSPNPHRQDEFWSALINNEFEYDAFTDSPLPDKTKKFALRTFAEIRRHLFNADFNSNKMLSKRMARLEAAQHYIKEHMGHELYPFGNLFSKIASIHNVLNEKSKQSALRIPPSAILAVRPTMTAVELPEQPTQEEIVGADVEYMAIEGGLAIADIFFEIMVITAIEEYLKVNKKIPHHVLKQLERVAQIYGAVRVIGGTANFICKGVIGDSLFSLLGDSKAVVLGSGLGGGFLIGSNVITVLAGFALQYGKNLLTTKMDQDCLNIIDKLVIATSEPLVPNDERLHSPTTQMVAPVFGTPTATMPTLSASTATTPVFGTPSADVGTSPTAPLPTFGTPTAAVPTPSATASGSPAFGTPFSGVSTETDVFNSPLFRANDSVADSQTYLSAASAFKNSTLILDCMRPSPDPDSDLKIPSYSMHRIFKIRAQTETSPSPNVFSGPAQTESPLHDVLPDLFEDFKTNPPPQFSFRKNKTGLQIVPDASRLNLSLTLFFGAKYLQGLSILEYAAEAVKVFTAIENQWSLTHDPLNPSEQGNQPAFLQYMEIQRRGCNSIHDIRRIVFGTEMSPLPRDSKTCAAMAEAWSRAVEVAFSLLHLEKSIADHLKIKSKKTEDAHVSAFEVYKRFGNFINGVVIDKTFLHELLTETHSVQPVNLSQPLRTVNLTDAPVFVRAQMVFMRSLYLTGIQLYNKWTQDAFKWEPAQLQRIISRSEVPMIVLLSRHEYIRRLQVSHLAYDAPDFVKNIASVVRKLPGKLEVYYHPSTPQPSNMEIQNAGTERWHDFSDLKLGLKFAKNPASFTNTEKQMLYKDFGRVVRHLFNAAASPNELFELKEKLKSQIEKLQNADVTLSKSHIEGFIKVYFDYIQKSCKTENFIYYARVYQFIQETVRIDFLKSTTPLRAEILASDIDPEMNEMKMLCSELNAEQDLLTPPPLQGSAVPDLAELSRLASFSASGSASSSTSIGPSDLGRVTEMAEVIRSAESGKASGVYTNEDHTLTFQSRLCPICRKYVVVTAILQRQPDGSFAEEATCPNGHIILRGG